MANPNEIPTHTLGELADILPKPDAATRAAYEPSEDPQALVQRGAQIASSRVVVDMRRLYAQAHDFWGGASPQQRALLVGFSPELLGLSVDRALALQDLVEAAATKGTASSGERAKLDHAARSAFSKGRISCTWTWRFKEPPNRYADRVARAGLDTESAEDAA